MPKVTVISSIYNKEQFLDKFFSSILFQSFTDFVFLVIDNGSTDNSKEKIQKYSKIDSRILPIYLEKNIGPAGAFALGIDNVKTDFFTICDSDDYVEKNFLQILYNSITSEEADVSMCGYDKVWGDGKVIVHNRPDKDKLVFTKKDRSNLLAQIIDQYSNKHLGCYLSEIGVNWGKMFRTEFIKSNNINYENDVWIWCDWLFNIRLFKQINKFVYINNILYHYYQSDNSMTRSTFKMDLKQKDRIYKAIIRIGEELKNDKNILSSYYYFSFRNVMMIANLYCSWFFKCKDIKYRDIKNVLAELKNWPGMQLAYQNNRFSISNKISFYCIKNNFYFLYLAKVTLVKFMKFTKRIIFR